MPKPMPPTFKARRRWTAVEGRAALVALASSGLSQSAFAAREGLDSQRHRMWRRKLGAVGAPTFVEVRRREVERVESSCPPALSFASPSRRAQRRTVLSLPPLRHIGPQSARGPTYDFRGWLTF
jgi:hypothetical protein